MYNINSTCSFKFVLTLTMPNFWNEIIHLTFLALSIIILEISRLKTWSWSECTDVQAGLALYCWQRLITFGSGRIRVNNIILHSRSPKFISIYMFVVSVSICTWHCSVVHVFIGYKWFYRFYLILEIRICVSLQTDNSTVDNVDVVDDDDGVVVVVDGDDDDDVFSELSFVIADTGVIV